MGIIGGILSHFGFDIKPTNGQINLEETKNMKIVSLETQLETFKKLGFTLN